MIISKIDKVRQAKAEALVALQTALTTEARSAEARQDAALRRELAEQTGLCAYCGMPLEKRSTRHAEACATCGRVVDNMLMSKSKVMAGTYSREMLRKMKKFYDTKLDAPYALRGVGIPYIKEAIDGLLEADQTYRDVANEAMRREAYRNLEQERKAKLRKEYLDFKPDLTPDELEEIVESQYVQRYIQDVGLM